MEGGKERECLEEETTAARNGRSLRNNKMFIGGERVLIKYRKV